jgi:hypothetical protein
MPAHMQTHITGCKTSTQCEARFHTEGYGGRMMMRMTDTFIKDEGRREQAWRWCRRVEAAPIGGWSARHLVARLQCGPSHRPTARGRVSSLTSTPPGSPTPSLHLQYGGVWFVGKVDLAEDILNHMVEDSQFQSFGCEGWKELDNRFWLFGWKDKKWLGIVVRETWTRGIRNY